jgi:hypothetical protein
MTAISKPTPGGSILIRGSFGERRSAGDETGMRKRSNRAADGTPSEMGNHEIGEMEEI